MGHDKGKGHLKNVCRARKFIDAIRLRRWEKNVKKP